jgi:hypothetical protein
MIALVLIARNESRCLARCLQSARPFVDEMVVVDTGSSDATPQIAVAEGARLAHFPWQEDFSAARNFALAQTQAQWRLVLDADEWIERGGENLRALANAAAREAYIGQVTVRSSFDDEGAVRHATNAISRVLPRGVEYAGRIHEQPVHALPVRKLDVVIGHDGYLRAHRAGKSDRNERLLRALAHDRPGDAYVLYQLGKELEIHGRFGEASEQYRHARGLVPWPPTSDINAKAVQARFPWLHDLAVRNLYCLKKSGALDSAMRQYHEESRYWQQSPDFHFAGGDMLLDAAIADPAHAVSLLAEIEASWMRCLEIGERPELEGAVEGRGSFLAAHNLSVLHSLQGHAEAAERFRALARTP